jgi:quinoprotein glucose dehydrogenase
VFDPMPAVDRTEGWSDFANRGVSTWLDGSTAAGAPCRRRIIVGTIDARLIAVDALTGVLCTGFGSDGAVDLRTGLRIQSRSTGSYQVTSPPAVVGDIIVTGSAIGDNSYLATASGEVRGYDARTGALRWTWDPIPQSNRDPAFSTWRDPTANVAAANAWSILVADPERDLVFVPTSSASPDYYGVFRLGANVYANSLVALRASTGEVVWHFQTVHHDLWDYDNASPPALVTLTREGRQVPAVLQATKTGMLFVLHRETGEPLFPVSERPVPRSTIPGEEAWPTQPFSPIVLSPHSFSLESVWGATAQDRDACRQEIAALRNEGIFTPPSEQGTLVIPSNIGGAHWGGVAVDEQRQVAVIPVNTIAASVQLLPRGPYDAGAPRAEAAGASNTTRCGELRTGCVADCCLGRAASLARRRRSVHSSPSISARVRSPGAFHSETSRGSCPPNCGRFIRAASVRPTLAVRSSLRGESCSLARLSMPASGRSISRTGGNSGARISRQALAPRR